FSSRRRHTRSYGDWSSDVCSSDLQFQGNAIEVFEVTHEYALAGELQSLRTGIKPDSTCLERLVQARHRVHGPEGSVRDAMITHRSEERRVGKECRTGWSPDP